jgi:acyl-CoA synthetase (AMP-forming)/AMP-acid ligase II
MSEIATTFYELFADNLPRRADKVFVIDPLRAYTYGEVAVQADRIACWLTENGVRPGDRVIVQLRKSMREVAAMLAVARIGGVIVNVNPALTTDQLRYVCEDSGASALILELTASLVAGRNASVLLADSPEWHSLVPGRRRQAVPVLDSALCTIIYTSGSTGKPKGVMLSHRNILAGARSVARYLGLGPNDRLLSVLPYSFDYGLNQLTTMMLMGGTVIHQPVAMATEVVRALQAHRATGLAAVPPLFIQLVRLLETTPAHFPTLRRVTNSGGKIPDAILRRMPIVFPEADLVLMYGLTEAFRSTYLHPERFEAKLGAIGRAVPGAEVYLIKHGQGVAGPGEQGELVHRGPLVSLGYWNNPEATAAKIRPCPELAGLIGDEPVVYSGDIVRCDGDGDLWFVGRNDALIKTSGFRVSPDEVEDLIHHSAMAADVVAFGVADDMLGQTIHVAVTLLPGATREALMEFCRKAMPAYMVPRTIHVWPETMPRTPSGKLARPDVVRACQSMTMPPPRPTPAAAALEKE